MDGLLMKKECIVRFQPVVDRIEELLACNSGTLLVAIDGMCASGKTTLGWYLKEKFDCNLFHMDDFFLQSHQKTPERLGEVGGNVDYERFYEEVIQPILSGREVVYRPYSCKDGQIAESVTVSPKRLNVVEGSYSCHPYFGQIFNLKVFTEISPELQRQRIIMRNGVEKLARFESEWIPKEQAYFEKFAVREGCLVIGG